MFPPFCGKDEKLHNNLITELSDIVNQDTGMSCHLVHVALWFGFVR